IQEAERGIQIFSFLKTGRRESVSERQTSRHNKDNHDVRIHFHYKTVCGLFFHMGMQVRKQSMQMWRAVPPKPISIKFLQEIIQSLDGFMPGLETIDRSIETKVVTNGEQNVLSGSD